MTAGEALLAIKAITGPAPPWVVMIEVKGDCKPEVDKTFHRDLFGLRSNALFDKNRGVATIPNDD